jgi:transcriptional regulator with PAS, ATPase and Fis domain
MTTTETPMRDEGPQFNARRVDRRLGLIELVSTLSAMIVERADTLTLRGAFEDALKRVVPVRSIHLRDAVNRWSCPAEAAAAETIAFEVPGPSGGGVLLAALEPGSHIGDWDFQMLRASAHLASLLLEVERQRALLARAGLGPTPKGKRDGAAPLIGASAAMRILRSQIERVASTDFTVLLEGESGVGKELVARQIHELSRRRNGPFVAVNCAALVETLVEAELFGIEDRTATGVRGRRGKFEHADGGTLFLDEVSDLSSPAQAKLLRAIQDLAVERVGGQGAHRVDIRIVAATNRPLSGLVEGRLFRHDLFYRLGGVEIRVPPLRERRTDILELARYFIERHKPAKTLRLSAAAAEALLHYDWPGNVRELERVIERAVALGASNAVELDDLPPTVRGDYGLVLEPALRRQETLRTWAARYARLVLERAGGNRREAARQLGISYHTLVVYLRHGTQGNGQVNPDAGGRNEEERPAVGGEEANVVEA